MISINLNGDTIKLPENIITLKDLMKWKNISEQSTAIAINGVLAKLNKSDLIKLNPMDKIIVITAAFGG